MDDWRLVLVLYVVFFATNQASAQLDVYTFNDELYVPSEPLTPLDFKNALTLDPKLEPNMTEETDPIHLADLFEGDIVLPQNADPESEANNSSRNAIMYEKQKWPRGIVPYLISSQFSSYERSIIAKAISDYHENTCIKFRPRSHESSYIHIVKGNGCSSPVGRTGGAQSVSLGRGCVYPGIVVHELMHVVGFWHEQSRYDRDQHVTVYMQNVQRGMEYNFKKFSWNHIQNLGASYDTGSVMHYGKYAFSKGGNLPTIVPNDPNVHLGQRRGFSEIDLWKVNKLYDCGATEESTQTTTTTTTPSPVVKCADSHKHCEAWSKRGECSKNPAWMLVNCPISCDSCQKACADKNKHCNYWAKIGECSKNEAYMSVYCARSCDTCTN